jgi:hypothetical protein
MSDKILKCLRQNRTEGLVKKIHITILLVLKALHIHITYYNVLAIEQLKTTGKEKYNINLTNL